jgi:hypothetical protein
MEEAGFQLNLLLLVKVVPFVAVKVSNHELVNDMLL